jgi:hypothetical protein
MDFPRTGMHVQHGPTLYRSGRELTNAKAVFQETDEIMVREGCRWEVESGFD